MTITLFVDFVHYNLTLDFAQIAGNACSCDRMPMKIAKVLFSSLVVVDFTEWNPCGK